MAATALIKFTQGALVGAAGEALVGVPGVQVDIENDDPTDVQSWKIDLVYVPPGSGVAITTPLAQGNGAVPFASFTPDATPGCYRVFLYVYSSINQTGTSNVDARCFAIPDVLGKIYPPYQQLPAKLPVTGSGVVGEKPDEMNFGGQPYGWAGEGTDGLLLDFIRSTVSIMAGAWQEPVLDKDLSAPPGGPTLGDRYIVGAGASGDWAGQDDDIATWDGTAWVFLTPIEGATTYVDDEAVWYRFEGGSWTLVSGGGGAVSSVFGRTGAVVAAAGDYDAIQVDYDNSTSGLAATDVKGALDEVTAGLISLIGSIPPPAPVDSVFGRTGAVVAVSGDYTALEVDYDNSGSGLVATDVQAAIDEVLAAASAPVASVFGRTGAVVAVAGDYTALEVDYDNSGSGLVATDVQAAIDEVLAAAAAPVSSVFGRAGAVVAAASDYDADQVDYDNAISGLTATDVKAAIDELAATGGGLDIAALTEEVPEAGDWLVFSDTSDADNLKKVDWDDLPGGPSISAAVQTTDDTPTTIHSYSTLNDSSSVLLKFTVHAIDALGNMGVWDVVAGAYRSNASVVTVKDVAYLNGPFKDSAASAWDVDVLVSGQDLNITVTGPAADTVDWGIIGEVTELQGPSLPPFVTVLFGTKTSGRPVIQTSDDGGVTWVERVDGQAPNEIIRTAARNPTTGTMIGAGDNGIYFRSVDSGVTWSQVGIFTGSDEITAVWYGNGMFIIGHFQTAVDAFISRSIDDGLTLAGTVNPEVTFGDQMYDGVWAEGIGLHVGVGNGGNILTSPDGIAWTKRTPDGSYTGSFYGFLGIAWSESQTLLVAVGDGNEIQTSPDGINWTSRTPAGASDRIWSVCYSPSLDLWLIVGDVGGSARIETSPDGINWTSRTPDTPNAALYTCKWNPQAGLFVVAGNAGRVQTSPDGITWTARTTDDGYTGATGAATQKLIGD